MENGNSNYTILYFLDYGQSFGGAANTLLQQAILMKKAGHRIVLFFSDYFGNEMESGYEKICQNLGIEWKRITFQLSNQTEDIDVVCVIRNYENIKRVILAYHPDILHSLQINPSVELASRELEIPHVMNIYQIIPEFFSVEYLNIFPHYHLCDSWYFARMWQQYLKTDSSCIRTVVNSYNKRKKAKDNRFIKYICVGAVYKEKNQLTVIKAFHKALENGVDGKLVLCGNVTDHYAQNCLRYIENNMLEDKVLMKGFCVDMTVEYADCDVLICGSTRESYPNAISEAMANGLVIISTPVAGVPEVIKDGINGYLADGYSVDAVYAKIMEFQRDLRTGKIEVILENAEKTFQKHHASQAITSQLHQYYQYVQDDFQKRKREKNSCIRMIDVRSKFEGLLQRYMQNEKYFTEPGKIALKLWYLYHTEKAILSVSNCKSFYIWGTGKYAVVVKELIDTFLPEIKISGFLDSYKEGMHLDCTIYHPEMILQNKDTVIFIAAVTGQDEMIAKLKEYGKIYNKDYFILSPRRW